MNRITILEGPDGAGKTTLAGAWRSRLRDTGQVNHAWNHGPYLGQTGDYISTHYLRSMLHPSPNMFLDRSWFSEAVYGPIVRGIDRLEMRHHRVLERITFSRSAIQVICLPPYENCKKAYLARKELEYLEDESTLLAVWNKFDSITKTDDPQRVPTVVYDYTREPNLEDFVGLVEGLRPPQNEGPGHGHFHDRQTLVVHEYDLPVTPQMWLEPAQVMLSQQLEAFDIPERGLYWVGAIRQGGEETKPAEWLEKLNPKRIVAMGALAWAWCKRNGVKADAEIPSHEWWHRFRQGDEFTQLRDAFK